MMRSNKYFPVVDGVEFFLVGGIVRDTLIGKRCNDLDYVAVTDKSFDELVEAIEKAGGIILQVKPEFTTIKTKIDGHVIDIVMPRVDGEYKDGRRPEGVNPATSLEEDSNRRDFTINALYMDKYGAIMDYHNGQDDLYTEKMIRAIGNSEERFAEDYLRILRAVRFAIRFDFDIENDTWEAMRKNVNHLIDISPDRVREEINKMLKINPIETINYLGDLRVFEILPDLGLKLRITSKEKV